VLEGGVLKRVLQACEIEGIKVVREYINVNDIAHSDAAFISSMISSFIYYAVIFGVYF
jgi:hypothetical protein